MWTLHMYMCVPEHICLYSCFQRWGVECMLTLNNCTDDDLNMFDKYVVGRTPNINITNIYKFININKTNTYLILHWGEKCPFCFKCSNLATMGLNLQPSGFVPPSQQTWSKLTQLTVSTHSFSISTWNLLKSRLLQGLTLFVENFYQRELGMEAGKVVCWVFLFFYSCCLWTVNALNVLPQRFLGEGREITDNENHREKQR